uniref:Uncharacterized protein n=1 Tax=Amphora coffeiformis TaxID=265554 RepID=A0A7S3LAF0_9STRA|mmetsp:Transcript_3286/g.6571  ORF Transcript_3286/g.6571 Transcript_3286/m.6571 type:complete len:276 (+) Transcript_3286:88-915(+)|eukprot:scaffold6439_cov167-Amphora_coffeaeformis.AAC.10
MQTVEYRSPATKKKATLRMIDYRMSSPHNIMSSPVKQNRNAALVRATALSPPKKNKNAMIEIAALPSLEASDSDHCKSSLLTLEEDTTQSSWGDDGDLTAAVEEDIWIMTRAMAQKTTERSLRYQKKADKALAQAVRCYNKDATDHPEEAAMLWMRKYNYYQGRAKLAKSVRVQLEDLETKLRQASSTDQHDGNPTNHPQEECCQSSSNIRYETVLEQLCSLRATMAKKTPTTVRENDAELWQQLQAMVANKKLQKPKKKVNERNNDLVVVPMAA